MTILHLYRTGVQCLIGRRDEHKAQTHGKNLLLVLTVDDSLSATALNKYRGLFSVWSSWHSLKTDETKKRVHTLIFTTMYHNECRYDKVAPYRFALDRDTINLTQHCQTNGSPYCLVTHRNEFRNEWINDRCYLYHDTAKLPIMVIFYIFISSV